MNIFPLGTEALLIDLGNTISPEVNDQAIVLSHRLEHAGLPGIIFCAPAYTSLTVGFDPRQITFAQLRQHVLSLYDPSRENPGTSGTRILRIPVCYDDVYAPDLRIVMEQTSLGRDAIIETHCSTSYRVYMLGFLPGFTYLGQVADKLVTKRKENPRTQVPAGSIGLAGRQTGIYPVDAPGGWQIIGRTPVRTFVPEASPPFLVHPGDQVRFEPVSQKTYEALMEQVTAGTYQLHYGGQ